MIVIIGHGPSIVGKHLGPWLDKQFVVRLKKAERPTDSDWGTRTDVICATSHIYRTERPFWWAAKHVLGCDLSCRVWDVHRWMSYFRRFSDVKGPSTGLRAIMCAVEFMNPQEIGVAGFDNLLHGGDGSAKWWQPKNKYHWDADSKAERECAMSLGVKIVDVTDV